MLGRNARAVFATRLRRAHHRHAHLAHHRAHVGKVDVNQTRTIDHLGNAADRAVQHIVGGLEGVEHRHVLTQHLHQLFVRNDDQRIDVLGQRLDPRVGRTHASAFKQKGFGDDCNGQNPQLLRHLSHHGCRAGAGTTAHACGDE